MLAKLFQLRLSNGDNMEKGSGLVEAMVSLLILMIAVAGVGGILITSNLELDQLGNTSESQQCGMSATVSPAGSGLCPATEITQKDATVLITAGTVSSIQVPVDAINSSTGSSPSKQSPIWWQ